MSLDRRVLVGLLVLSCLACEREWRKIASAPPPTTAPAGPLAPAAEEVSRYVSSKVCVDDFREKYWPPDAHRAFASSDDGACGWSASGMSSPRFAAKAALRQCDLRRDEDDAPCRVVNVDGAWREEKDAKP
jgi:hypothetical protein